MLDEYDHSDDMYIIDDYLFKKAWPHMDEEQRRRSVEALASHDLPDDISDRGLRGHVLAADEVWLLSFNVDWISHELLAEMAILAIGNPSFQECVADDGLGVFVLVGGGVVSHTVVEPARLRQIINELAHRKGA
ncbi:MAG: hypothetical protein KGZ88_14095 [Methylomicrobium sp.]|nr:hypothetical protein [Methylomicrobium sp.]